MTVYLFLPYFYQGAVVDNFRNRVVQNGSRVGRVATRGLRCAGFNASDKRAASRLHDAHEKVGRVLVRARR